MKWISGILFLTVLGLGFLQWRSCNTGKQVDALQQQRDSIMRSKDSIQQNYVKVVAQDSLLRRRYRADTVRFRQVIDSLNQRRQAIETSYVTIKAQLKKTVSDLSSAITDSALLENIEQLKTQLHSASDLVDMLQDNSDQKDSAFTSVIAFRDSVIDAQQHTIDNLKANYDGLHVLFDRANVALDDALAQLKKNKRANVWRTIGEAILIVGLIIK